MKTFYCEKCGLFEDEGYDNPCFLADTVADCPKCGNKCWEELLKITRSEYEKLKIKPKVFD